MEPLSKKYEASYVLSSPITRVSQILNEIRHIEELNSKTQLPFIFTDKPIPLSFTYTVIEFTSVEHNKKLTWLLSSPNIPSSIHYTFNLVSNTLDNTTFLVFEIIIVNPEKIQRDKHQKINAGCHEICSEMINELEIMLQVNHDNIYQFESIIINAPREKVWNHFFSLQFLKNEYIEELQIRGKPDEVGTEINWVFKKDNVKCSCKISCLSNKPHKKKWKYKLSAIDGLLKSQDAEFTMIEISKKETFLFFYHRFNEQVTIDALKALENKKKKILILLKVLLEENYDKMKEKEKELDQGSNRESDNFNTKHQ